MTVYILKIVLCSALLLLIYFLFLEKEKMYKFNRFYLLFSIIFSFTVPFITIKTQSEIIPMVKIIDLTNESLNNNIAQQTLDPAKTNTFLPNYLLVVYIMVASLLLYRFIKNIFALSYKIRNNKSISYSLSKLVLTNDKLVPHSFLKYIFIDKEDYEKGAIEKEVLRHELTHVKQKHSIDIIFLELLLIFAWFNPVLFFYKKVILLNHEFLADDSVIKEFHNISNYQNLLLTKAAHSSSLLLSSQLNYLVTKKRLIMMTKITSPQVAISKQVALMPFIAVIAFLFCTKVIAQDTINVVNQAQKQIRSTTKGVSQKVLIEYENIIDKYKTADSKWWKNLRQKAAPADKDRLETIFKQMSKEQQSKQTVVFMPSPPPLPRVLPTKEQLVAWKDPKMYGLWINGKRVNNSALNKYSNADFEGVYISKLEKNAFNYGKHYYQVDLMTKEHYQNYYDQNISSINNIMMFRQFPTKERN